MRVVWLVVDPTGYTAAVCANERAARECAAKLGTKRKKYSVEDWLVTGWRKVKK